MTQAEKAARIERLREQIKIMRRRPVGHSTYVVDALELIVDLLEQTPNRHGG